MIDTTGAGANTKEFDAGINANGGRRIDLSSLIDDGTGPQKSEPIAAYRAPVS